MRFIHLSGLRLGEEVFDDPFGIDLRAERDQALLNVLSAARDGVIEAVFLTGDLLDHKPSLQEVQKLDELFLTVPKTRFFWLVGEKDRFGAEEPMGSYEWKSNTQVFLGDCIQRVFVARYDLEVTGIGWNPESWSKLRLEKLTPGRKGKIQILLLPFLTEDQKKLAAETKLPFDYVGVGGSEIRLGEQQRNLFSPGAFSPKFFDGVTQHGCFLGEITKEGKNPTSVTVRFAAGTQREFISLKVNADGKVSYDEVAEEAAKIMDQFGRQHFYRITITGKASPSLYFESEKLTSLGFVTEVTDETSRDEAISKLMDSHHDDALGRFLAEMAPDDDQEIRKKALSYGVDALLSVRGRE